MYSVSDRFLEAILLSRRVVTVVDVLYHGSVIRENIPISEGSISYDRSGSARASGSLTVADNDLNRNIFLPIGTEIVVRSGFRYTDGSTETVPLGYFRIESIDYDDGVPSELDIAFIDRSQALIDNLVDHTIDLSTQTYTSSINTLFAYTFDGFGYLPTITFDSAFDTNRAKRPPGGTTSDSNHFDIFQMFVDGWGGGEVYFDRDGNLHFGVIPSITEDTTSDDAVWRVAAGEVLIEASKNINRQGTYNRVAVHGGVPNGGTGAAPWARASDNFVGSPTYYNGPFGKKVLVIQNEALTTKAQCQQVANEKLKNYLGLSQNINFTSLLNPALEVGDIVVVEYLDGTEELHLIDQMTFPLKSGEMTCVTRTIQRAVA